MIICPICGGALERKNGALVCENGHSYDISRQGYVNLLPPGKMNNKNTGDPPEMVRARSEFFAGGAYSGVRDALVSLICEYSDTAADCGCGEGYYTNAAALGGVGMLGFDASKYAVAHASAEAKRLGVSGRASYFAANIFALPLSDSSVSCAVSMFAPVADMECARILTKGGHLIVGSAGKRHLFGLKSLVYGNPYENDVKIPEYADFEHIKRVNFLQTLTLSAKCAENLFEMTPYSRRTGIDDRLKFAEKLTALGELETEIEVCFNIYKKK